MPAQVLILTGPARSGKTFRLLADYRKTLAAGDPGCALWLAPNRLAVVAVRERLIAEPLTHCANPQCLTFHQFAQSVLEASMAPLRPLSELMKKQLLRGLIEQGTRTGKLVHFAPIADTSGLVELVSQTIRQWKRLEIWPDELAAACERVGFAEKDHELVWLYKEYQRLLNDHELYDAEGRFWSARARLRDGQRRPFERVRHVFVDGFTDFTRTEHEVLSILSERVERMIITLPMESGVRIQDSGVRGQETEREQVRSDLFAKPLRTLSELQRRHPGALVELLARRGTGWPAMDHLEANLFQLPAHIPAIDVASGVEIAGASGQLNEIESLARSVKRLLLGEAGSVAVRPGEILVISRSLDGIGPLVREVFDRYGIPAAIDMHAPLAKAAGVSALAAWLRLAAEDWPFRQVLAMLSHNSFRPTWREWQGGKAAIAAEFLVRELQIPVGRSELMRRIARWAEAANPADPPPSRRRELRTRRAQLAAPLLENLSKTLGSLPKSATATEWTTALTKFANRVGLSGLIANDTQERNAWDTAMAALRAQDRLISWLGPSSVIPTKLTLADVLERILEIAQNEILSAQLDDVGSVRVVIATTARSLCAPYVFVVGLSEKSFPAPDPSEALYSESEIERLIQSGLPLVARAQRSQEEMLLFYEIVTRATRRLVLSYPALDAKAQPLSPSPYLLELERAFVGCQIERPPVNELSPVPPDDEVMCERDLRVRAVSQALQGASGLLAGMLRQDTSATNLLPALEITHARGREGFGPFEGVFLSEAALTRIGQRFGPDRCWSASQLEAYAYCPYRFFAERLLRLEPLGDLSLEVDYLMRGNLLHGALANYHRALNDSRGVPTSPTAQTFAEFEAAADTVLDSLLASIATDQPLEQAMRDVDRRLLREWLANYYEQHIRYDAMNAGLEEPLRPTYFEVPFGPPSDSLDDPEDLQAHRDDLGATKPLELKQGDETLHVRGRVDRVDVGRVAGRTVFNVVDYKSGRQYALKLESIASGEIIQLPLYALAVEQILLAAGEALPWRAGYWPVQGKGFNTRNPLKFHECVDGELQAVPEWIEAREQLLGVVFSLVRGIRGGEFPMHCGDEHCTRNCDFKTICRVAQVRSLDKSWQPPGQPLPEAGK